ncbi:Gfo/Idh/MocA family protein [Lignipirellula cremea]|uniref:Oxidoreductase family, NAD-binding Rossmann fold n=1 Tax=Lignipirellula cremea TaxID=2528010 RepID=A0A518E4Q9_9BACT|nr:Gfo/Idh/MocA family oxidoreductase [Lignipirellula cremea]QDU99058.1 Oxidoreductase family, NAD-binding Rossmann fold [Lignipirellula cremea]
MIRSRLLLALAASLFLLPAGLLHADEPVRVGILGFDNYQAVEYAAFFNNPQAEGDLDGLLVTAAWPVLSDSYPQSAELTERWKPQMLNRYQDPKSPRGTAPPIKLVDSLEELLANCDVVMIWSLDGRKHVEQATPVLKAGKPLFIGRPAASSVEDTVALYRLAAETGTPFWSCSQHRYSPGFSGMRNHPEVGNVLGCDVYGGYDPNAPEADRFIRPLHSIETMYAIMGPGCVKVSCASTPKAEVYTCVWDDGRVATYRGIKEGAVKYSATVFGDKGVSTAGIYGHGVPEKGIVPTKDKYMGYGGLAIELAKFFKTRKVPVAASETLEIFALMQAADESREQNGAFQPVARLLEAK